jgi:hypothetical protein
MARRNPNSRANFSAQSMALDDLSPFTWRACWRLCVPALVVAFVVRLLFCLDTPEAYYGSDSNSYFDTADALWNHGKFAMGPKRRGVYPLVIALAPALPGNTARVVAVLQHALAMAALLGVGWVTGHLTRRRAFWVPVITCVAAILPQPLWYEHEIIADSFVVQFFILAVALAFPTDRLRGRRLMWFLIAAAAIVACKPHGRPLWAGLVASALLLAGNPLRWGWKCHAVLAATVAIILGTGSAKQGSWLLMSSALPLIETENGIWPEYRHSLRAVVNEARVDLANYPWRQGQFKKRIKDPQVWKESPAWHALLAKSRSDEFSKVAKRFALEAIVRHPFVFGGFILKKIGMVLWAEDVDTKFSPKRFWHEQHNRNAERWQRDPKEVELLYEMKQQDYLALEAERAQRRPLLSQRWLEQARHLHWVKGKRRSGEKFHDLSLTWIGGLGLLGLAWCLSPANFRRTSPLWLPCLLYVALIYTIGDAVRRYLLPIEWVLALLVALGLEWLIDFALRFFRRRGKRSEMTPPPAPVQ